MLDIFCKVKGSLVIVVCFGLCLAGCSAGANVVKSDSGGIAYQAQPISVSGVPDSWEQIAIVDEIENETKTKTIKTATDTTEDATSNAASDTTANTATGTVTDTAADTAIDAAVDAAVDVATVTAKAIVTTTSATTDGAAATVSEETTNTPGASSEPAASINVIVSGKMLVFDGQQPVLKDGEVLVPVFGVFEHLYGANGNKESPFSVSWDNQTSTAMIKNRWYTVVAVSGEHDFTCNGNRVAPTVPQQMIDGAFMLPLTAIAQAIDATVEWGGGGDEGESKVEGDQSKNTISIFYESMVMAGELQ